MWSVSPAKPWTSSLNVMLMSTLDSRTNSSEELVRTTVGATVSYTKVRLPEARFWLPAVSLTAFAGTWTVNGVPCADGTIVAVKFLAVVAFVEMVPSVAAPATLIVLNSV